MKDFCWKQIGVWGDKSCSKLQEYSHCRDCPTFSQEGRALFNREPPQDYLTEWVSLIGQKQQPVSDNEKVAHVFRLMSEWLALPAHCLVEVIGLRPVKHIPHRSGNILLGLVSVRGEIHLCVSLINLLGIEKDENQSDDESQRGNSRLCVIRKDSVSWIFPADEVYGLISYSEKDAEAVPSTVAKSYQNFTQGLLSIDGRKIGLLDETPIFDALSRNVT